MLVDMRLFHRSFGLTCEESLLWFRSIGCFLVVMLFQVAVLFVFVWFCKILFCVTSFSCLSYETSTSTKVF